MNRFALSTRLSLAAFMLIVPLTGDASAQGAAPDVYNRVQSGDVRSENALPEDIRVAVRTAAALTRGIRDEKSFQPVRFERGVLASLEKPQTTLSDFEADRLGISAILEPDGGKQGRKVVGTLRYIEEAGRAALMGFSIDYGFTRDAMTVRQASIFTVMPEKARWLAYFVPKSRAGLADWQRLETWGDAMETMKRFSVSAAEARKEESWIVIFALDRLPAGGQVLATLDGRPEQLVARDFAGWPVFFGEMPPVAKGPSVLKVRYGPLPPASGAAAEGEFRF